MYLNIRRPISMGAQTRMDGCPYILLIPAFGYLLAITYIRLLTRTRAFFLGNSYSRLEKRSLGHEIHSRSWKGRLYPESPVGHHFPSPAPPLPAPPPEARATSATYSGIPTPPGSSPGNGLLICAYEKPFPSSPRTPRPPRIAAPSFRECC